MGAFFLGCYYLLFLSPCPPAAFLQAGITAVSASKGGPNSHGDWSASTLPPSSPERQRSRYFERDEFDDGPHVSIITRHSKGATVHKNDSKTKFAGLGREYERVIHPGRRPNAPLRGGSEDSAITGASSSSASSSSSSPVSFPPYRKSYGAKDNSGGVYYRRRKPSYSSSVRVRRGRSYDSYSSPRKKGPVRAAWEWIREGNLPKIQVRVEPNTTLKLRKTFRPLKTVVQLGADFNTQLGVWQFKSSWEDSIIGGRLTLAGRELQLSKTWLLSVGAVEDLVTRLRFRAAVDLGTGKAYARFGFRTERLSPINVVEGFTLVKQLPLDGNRGNVKLEVKANFAFPEPEIEYSTENNRSIVGMGDIEINIDELNLLLDY